MNLGSEQLLMHSNLFIDPPDRAGIYILEGQNVRHDGFPDIVAVFPVPSSSERSVAVAPWASVRKSSRRMAQPHFHPTQPFSLVPRTRAIKKARQVSPT